MAPLYLKREIILCSHDADQLVHSTHTLFRTPVHRLCQDVRQILQTHTHNIMLVSTQVRIIERFLKGIKCIHIVLRINQFHCLVVDLLSNGAFMCVSICLPL